MSLASVGAFWVVSFLFVVTPGADWAYAISAGLRHRVLPAVVGLISGHLLATVVVAAGVGSWIASAPAALVALTIAGALYLVWLGIGTLRQPPAELSAAEVFPRSRMRWALGGAGVSGLNPKVFLLFLALLPQFVTPSAAWPAPAQIALLGAVHAASCAVVYSLVGAGARTVLSTRPRAALAITRISGSAMILIGLVLISEQLITLGSH